MALLLLRHPFLERFAVQRRLVERGLLHEFLPIGSLADLLEHVHVEVDLLLRDPGRHEDAAQHLVLDVEPHLLAGRDVVPRHVLGDLGGVGHALAVEHAQRAQLAGAPLLDRLDRVVHRRIDVLADQLHGDLAAALVGDVGELRAGLLLDQRRDDLVFLLRSRAAHLELVGPGLLDRVDVLHGRLVGRIGVHPEDELVERHHLDGREVLPAERHARGHRRGEQVGERDDDLVGVALGVLHVEEALGAGAAGLVLDHHRLLHQVVLGDHALDEPGHLVGAASRSRGNDELDGLGGFPRESRHERREHGACDGRDANAAENRLVHFCLLGRFRVPARNVFPRAPLAHGRPLFHADVPAVVQAPPPARRKRAPRRNASIRAMAR